MTQAEAVLPIERETMRTVIWRIVPFLMLAYFIAFLDRVNAGFAALQMNQDIGLTPAQYGSILLVLYGIYRLIKPAAGAVHARKTQATAQKLPAA